MRAGGGADSHPWHLEFGDRTSQAGASLVGRALCGFPHALHRSSASRVAPEEDSEAEPGLLWMWPVRPLSPTLLPVTADDSRAWGAWGSPGDPAVVHANVSIPLSTLTTHVKEALTLCPPRETPQKAGARAATTGQAIPWDGR